MTAGLMTATGLVKAPLLYKGKVRELYDLGDTMLLVATDRISAFDWVLEPAVPGKGAILNQMSLKWFGLTKHLVQNHVVHADVERLGDLVTDKLALRDRIMVVKKAERIPVECVVRGYLAGDGWRQYQATGEINGRPLPAGLEKNARLPSPIFTPARKQDVGHDENMTIREMGEWIGWKLTQQLERLSLALFDFASAYCSQRGIILADSKFEFGLINNELVLIDELVTPDSSRFWAQESYATGIDLDSLDKEPVRRYLASSGWDRQSPPAPLPDTIIEGTAARYQDIMNRLFGGLS